MAENPWGDNPRTGRFAGMLAVAGGATAIASLALAAAAGAPYLATEGVNGWIVVFAAGLLAALISFPFGIELRLRERYPDRDRRWEVSLLVWGGLAALLLAIAVVAGFDTGTLAGAASLIAAIEAAGVVVTIGFWLLSSG